MASNHFVLHLYSKETIMPALLDITYVTATENHQLALEFENGERRVFNMQPYLVKRPFGPLKDIAMFKLARVENGTVTWPGDIDIAPETLYDKSVSSPCQ
jgi:hypothetical protein